MTNRVRSVLLTVIGAVVLAGVGASLDGHAATTTQRLGVVGFYNPRLVFLKYLPLVDYLSESTGVPWELKISASSEQLIGELCRGEVEVAHLGAFAYVRAHQRCGALPAVQVRTRGATDHRVLLVVREDSGIETIEDLADKRLGFGEPTSTSSHLTPCAMLIEAGVEVQPSQCRYYAHDERATRGVLLGEVDACAVRDGVGQRLDRGGLRVVARSRPVPNDVLAMTSNFPGELGERLVAALVRAPQQDPRVARRFMTWDGELRDGFFEVSDAVYEPVRSMARQVFGDDALKRPEIELQCQVRMQ